MVMGSTVVDPLMITFCPSAFDVPAKNATDSTRAAHSSKRLILKCLKNMNLSSLVE
jgi:hypothetical protein